MYVRSAAQLKSFMKELPWHHHLAYFPPPTRVVRQKDQRYSTLLTKIGDGCALDSEIALFESCFVSAIEALMKGGMVKFLLVLPGTSRHRTLLGKSAHVRNCFLESGLYDRDPLQADSVLFIFSVTRVCAKVFVNLRGKEFTESVPIL